MGIATSKIYGYMLKIAQLENIFLTKHRQRVRKMSILVQFIFRMEKINALFLCRNGSSLSTKPCMWRIIYLYHLKCEKTVLIFIFNFFLCCYIFMYIQTIYPSPIIESMTMSVVLKTLYHVSFLNLAKTGS